MKLNYMKSNKLKKDKINQKRKAIFLYFIHLFIHLFISVLDLWRGTTKSTCKGQGGSCGCFSPFTTCAKRMKFMLSDLVTSIYPPSHCAGQCMCSSHSSLGSNTIPWVSALGESLLTWCFFKRTKFSWNDASIMPAMMTSLQCICCDCSNVRPR